MEKRVAVGVVAESDDHRVRTPLEPVMEGVPANMVSSRRRECALLDYASRCPATGPARTPLDSLDRL